MCTMFHHWARNFVQWSKSKGTLARIQNTSKMGSACLDFPSKPQNLSGRTMCGGVLRKNRLMMIQALLGFRPVILSLLILKIFVNFLIELKMKTKNHKKVK